jgi:hypothetical protein
MDYVELFSRLSSEVAIVAFYKKNGEFRTMLATRNINAAAIGYGYLGRKLGGHDARCNASNGNISVIDLIIGEARSFNISRVVDVTWLGNITTPDELEEATKVFREYTDNYKKATAGSGLFDNLETETTPEIKSISADDINKVFESNGNSNPII